MAKDLNSMTVGIILTKEIITKTLGTKDMATWTIVVNARKKEKTATAGITNNQTAGTIIVATAVTIDHAGITMTNAMTSAGKM